MVRTARLPPRILAAVTLLAALASGCSSSVRVVLVPKSAAAAGIKVENAVAADSKGSVFLAGRAQRQIVRIFDRGERFENLLVEETSLEALCVTDEDVLMVLCPDKVGAFFAGKIIPILSLPARGKKISCHENRMYLVVRNEQSQELLYRYDVDSKKLVPLMKTEQTISAICGVRGGCLMAVGDSIYKFFDDPSGGEYHLVFLCAVSEATIVSVAAYPKLQAVFFSDHDVTYVWAEGRVYPFFPLGGGISLQGDTLTIASEKTQQVIQVPRVDQRLLQLREELYVPGRK